MSTHRMTRRTRLLGFLPLAALLAGACSPDANGPSNLELFADRQNMSPASGFTVLANAAVTCTDGSIIGDVGTFLTAPPGAVTLTNCPLDGSIHIGDAAAVAAYNAFLAEYAALAPQLGDICPVIPGTLAGVTLTPGVYCVSSEAKTGVLTLSGGPNATWLIKVPDGALTGTNFTVILASGALACNVTWWVDAAATMTDSRFIGNILAGAAITLTRGTFDGNVWAGADGVGDVTITGTTVVGCEGQQGNGNGQEKDKCNQGVGNGPEACDPGNSNHRRPTNDEDGGTPGNPGRKGGR